MINDSRSIINDSTSMINDSRFVINELSSKNMVFFLSIHNFNVIQKFSF